MFLLVTAYPGSPGPKAVKPSCVCVCVCEYRGLEQYDRRGGCSQSTAVGRSIVLQTPWPPHSPPRTVARPPKTLCAPSPTETRHHTRHLSYARRFHSVARFDSLGFLLTIRAQSTPSCSWRRGVVVSGVRRMNEVITRRARLVLGWVTVFGRVYHLGM